MSSLHMPKNVLEEFGQVQTCWSMSRRSENEHSTRVKAPEILADLFIGAIWSFDFWTHYRVQFGHPENQSRNNSDPQFGPKNKEEHLVSWVLLGMPRRHEKAGRFCERARHFVRRGQWRSVIFQKNCPLKSSFISTYNYAITFSDFKVLLSIVCQKIPQR